MVPSHLGVQCSIIESNLKKPVAMARFTSPTTTSFPSIRKHTASTINLASKAETTGAFSSQDPQGILQELSIDQVQNSSIAPLIYQNQDYKLDSCPLEAKSIKLSRGPRHRAPIDPFIFEPLDAVQEESTFLSGSASIHPGALTTVTRTAQETCPPTSQPQSYSVNLNESHPLYAAFPERPKREQIQRHLAGQFEWLISCPATVSSAKGHHTSEDDNDRATGTMVYGCNLLSRQRQSAPQKGTPGCPLANSYTLIATPIEGDASMLLSDLDVPQSLVNMALDQPPAYDSHQTTPLKVPEVEVDEVVEQAVSPSLTLISDRSSSYAGGSSRAGSFSVPRIEDSLEELDKLEDELEAVNAFTQHGRINSSSEVKVSPKCLEPPQLKKSGVYKRTSMSGLSSTVRVKQSDKAQPPIRRSTSLVFRNKKDDAKESPRLRSQLSRGQLVETKLPKPPVKSTKPLTVPNFELPGEATARRLKEKREARLAQQAEAQKAYVPPPRPKSKKPLTKPAFELPGEAISRRKREEREARRQAQEEEEKKRREFKARPLRTSGTPSSIPRETVTSRARQGKPPHDDDAEKKRQQAKLKRFSVPSLQPAHGGPVDGKATNARGRLSNMASDENLSRGTSTSAGSSSSKRHTVTAEDVQQLRLKGKHIFERDNTSYTQDKEREKRGREAAARAARAEAAERSRMASREWAEKRRRKDMATMLAMKVEPQPSARSMIEN
ncbi:hypothetical protein B0T10DRAFT_84453 [Thelonectria olida]|uniref:Carboxylesterase family protein n=1 Tax=Thelonectria olida TaxID=1576542 RepID=A0A9P8W200_9HYPO|nr:hypothetical protein B0T10DRAFT_84453 [Thelonectria olida]